MQQAFSGELVEQDPQDEPASILLERIRQEREELEKSQKKSREKSTTQTKREPTMDDKKSLYQALLDADGWLTPEQLFTRAGFIANEPNAVDNFYEELRNELRAGHIIELRPDNEAVFLEAIQNENKTT